jgi:hypothetical protein
MSKGRWRGMRMIVLVAALGVASIVPLEAGSSSDRAAAMGGVAGKFEALSRKVPSAVLNKLSSGVRNYVNIAQRWKSIASQTSGAADESAFTTSLPSALPLAAPSGISSPGRDVQASRFSGFVQSETSSAWCGTNVVVGYNDTASFFLQSVSGFTVVGYAVSTNSGNSFTGGRALIPGVLPAGVTERDFMGDPVVGCASKTNFFFSTLTMDTLNDSSQISGVSVTFSVDGGFTFDNTVMAAGKDYPNHLLDKDWLTVDPTNGSRLYVTYTDFDSTGALCPGDTRLAIEIVTSADGGATWSSPTVVKETCSTSTGAVQGSQVVVGSGGEVYVAYESFDAFGSPQIEVARSNDQAQSFTTPLAVATVAAVGGVSIFGNGQATLQGNFKSNEFPSLAIDRSPKPSEGNVYIAWNDGGNGFVFDPLGEPTSYAYADVLFTRSTDGGVTWSAPVRVNNNPEFPFAASSPRTDQYEPGLAVDQTNGKLGLCFYDRRRDPKNFRIDRECAKSTNQGNTWSNTRITANLFPPEVNQDPLVVPGYMGDYDTVASDFLRTKSGFFGAWGDNTKGNPDVTGAKF